MTYLTFTKQAHHVTRFGGGNSRSNFTNHKKIYSVFCQDVIKRYQDQPCVGVSFVWVGRSFAKGGASKLKTNLYHVRVGHCPAANQCTVGWA